jgi:hypothetical protein
LGPESDERASGVSARHPHHAQSSPFRMINDVPTRIVLEQHAATAHAGGTVTTNRHQTTSPPSVHPLPRNIIGRGATCPRPLAKLPCPGEAARPFDARCLAFIQAATRSSVTEPRRSPPSTASCRILRVAVRTAGPLRLAGAAGRSHGGAPRDPPVGIPVLLRSDRFGSGGATSGAPALAERPRWRRRARADEHGQNGHGDPFSSGQKRMMRHDPNVDYDLLDTVRSVGLRSVKPSSVFIENPYLYHPLIVDALCAAKRARPSVSWPRGRRGLRADRVDRGQGIRLAQPTRRPGCRPESLASRLRPRCVRRESSGAADSGSPSLDAAPGVASSA